MWNKSTSYIMPLLGYKMTENHLNYLYNTYLYFTGIEHALVIVLDTDESKTFSLLHTYLINRDDFLMSLEDSNDRIAIVMQIKDTFSYEMFEKGKYSLMRQSAKEKIVDFWRPLNPVLAEKLRRVLTRDKILKKKLEEQLAVILPDTAELSSIIEKSNETYGI